MNLSPQQQHSNEVAQWQQLIIEEQRIILANTHKNPIQKLMDVFGLFLAPFPIEYLKEIGLYDVLFSLSKANKENIPTFLQENTLLIQQSMQIFENHKVEIRQYSVELYYSLLDFKDFLKCNRIYPF